MATEPIRIPIRQVAKEITNVGPDMFVLLDDGLTMGKAKASEAIDKRAKAVADQEIAALNLGTAAQSDAADFATALQGTKADTAVQPEDIGSAANADISDFATAAQGALADSALQGLVPGDNVSVDASDPANPVISTPSVSYNPQSLDAVKSLQAQANIGPVKFDTVADLLADTILSNAPASGRVAVAPGKIVEAQGFRYEIAVSSAADHHVETAGGVKLYVLPLGDDSFNLLQFGVDASGPISLQLPTEVAAGRKVVIPAGDWSVMNADLTGAWLEFSEGAKFVSVLGADDNGINTSGGTRITGRPHFVVSNTAMPAQGGKGAIIAMGTYVTDGEVYDGLEIHNPIFECLNTSAMGLAMSIIGRSEGVRIVGEAVMRGRFAGGFQAHWGGDFDGGDPHESLVSASYHPNNIRIDTMILERGGPSNLGGHLGLSLSAAYDVEVKTLINRGWDRTDWIQPGDVYDLVAAPDQKDKIMSGIRVLFTEIINPVANTSSYNNILVSGVSATIRVAGQTQLVLAADRQGMSVEHGEIRVICEPGYAYTTNPIVRMIAAKNSRYVASFEGFGSAVAAALSQNIGCVDCYSKHAGKDASRLVMGHNNIRHTYDLDWLSQLGIGTHGPSHRVAVLGSAAGSAVTGNAAAKGDGTLNIASWSGVGPEYWPKGSRLYLADGSYVVFQISQLVGPGVSTLRVDKLQSAIPAGTTLACDGKEIDSVITGSVVGAYIPIELVNTDGVSVPATLRRSGKHDVALSGEKHRRTLFNGVYDQCGQLDDGGLLVNVHLGAASVTTEGVSARGGVFEPSGKPLVAHNIYGRAANNAHAGLSVTDCDLNSTGIAVNYLWPTDGAVAAKGLPQIFGNRRKDQGQIEFDPIQGAAMRVGNSWHIWRASLPGGFSVPDGSRWYPTNPVVGQPKGQIRAGGAWVSEGNL